MIVALTGHRSEDCESEESVRIGIRTALQCAPRPVTAVICGMANGVDLWGGDEALSLGIPVWAAKPWTTHQPRKSDVELYARIIENAERVVNVTEADDYPGPWVYQVRNEWMVDHADEVLAYWSGKKKGGTWNCIKYANKVGKEPLNCYES